MVQTFEATIEKRDKWYIGWVEAVPGAFSQGRTIKEVEGNLRETLRRLCNLYWKASGNSETKGREGKS
jgi:predicted RNase H-like HicB family nuclease